MKRLEQITVFLSLVAAIITIISLPKIFPEIWDKITGPQKKQPKQTIIKSIKKEERPKQIIIKSVKKEEQPKQTIKGSVEKKAKGFFYGFILLILSGFCLAQGNKSFTALIKKR